MPRRSRIQLVGKAAQLAWQRQADELATLACTLHREWHTQDQQAGQQLSHVLSPAQVVRGRHHVSIRHQRHAS